MQRGCSRKHSVGLHTRKLEQLHNSRQRPRFAPWDTSITPSITPVALTADRVPCACDEARSIPASAPGLPRSESAVACAERGWNASGGGKSGKAKPWPAGSKMVQCLREAIQRSPPLRLGLGTFRKRWASAVQKEPTSASRCYSMYTSATVRQGWQSLPTAVRKAVVREGGRGPAQIGFCACTTPTSHTFMHTIRWPDQGVLRSPGRAHHISAQRDRQQPGQHPLTPGTTGPLLFPQSDGDRLVHECASPYDR